MQMYLSNPYYMEVSGCLEIFLGQGDLIEFSALQQQQSSS